MFGIYLTCTVGPESKTAPLGAALNTTGLGWLMGLEIANQVVDLIEKIQQASRAVPLSLPPVRAGLHETTNTHHSGAIPSPSQGLVTLH
jgi:hypothetical protein